MATKKLQNKTSINPAPIGQSDKANIYYLTKSIARINADLAFTRDTLSSILDSTTWAIAEKIFIATKKLKIDKRVKSIIKKPRAEGFDTYTLVNKLPPKRLIPNVYDLSPYKNILLLKEIAIEVIAKDFDPHTIKTAFSMATPVWNEAAGILDFLNSIKSQTLKPNEILLVDDYSTDDTVKIIEDFQSKNDLNIIIIKLKERVPISHVRNAALKKASNEIIVMADAGTILDKNYCANLVGTFAAYPNADLVAGIWQPIVSSPLIKQFVPEWDTIDWHKFLPSTRSMAIKKSLAKKFGNFPEHIFYGDDTLFDVKLRQISKLWVFNKNAKTDWDAPVTEEQYNKVSFNYGTGDGENGLGEYLNSDIMLGAINSDLILNYMPVNQKYLEGFLNGRKNRAEIEIDKRKIKGVIVFLTTIPFYENNQTKIYTEILRLVARNYKVICIHFYPNLTVLDHKKYAPLDYTLLELYFADNFDTNEFFARYSKKDIAIELITQGSNEAYDNIMKQFKLHKIPISSISD